MSSSEEEEDSGDYVSILDNHERTVAYFYPEGSDGEGEGGEFQDSSEITQGYITYMDEEDEDNDECHTYTDSSEITIGYFTPEEEDGEKYGNVSDASEVTLGYVTKKGHKLVVTDKSEITLGYVKGLDKDMITVTNSYDQTVGYIDGLVDKEQVALIAGYLFFMPGGNFLGNIH